LSLQLIAGAGQSSLREQVCVHSDAWPKLWHRHEAHVESPVQIARYEMVPGVVHTGASGSNGLGSFPHADRTTAMDQASKTAMREATAR
jgi:hypothetical protein